MELILLLRISFELFGATVGVTYMFCVVWRYLFGCFFPLFSAYYLYFLLNSFATHGIWKVP